MTGICLLLAIKQSINDPDTPRTPPVLVTVSEQTSTEWHLCMYDEISLTKISLTSYLTSPFCCCFLPPSAASFPCSGLQQAGGFFWFLTIIGIHPRIIIFSIIDLLFKKDSKIKTYFCYPIFFPKDC